MFLAITLCGLLLHIHASFAAQPEIQDDDVFLFSFFRGNGEAGVYLAVSEDGTSFRALNKDRPVMEPARWEGQDLTRDPSVVYHDGMFHMVWTTGWNGPCFGYATSKDLVDWSAPARVDPFGAERIPMKTWAPEICWDPFQQNFMIFWSALFTYEVGQQVYLIRTADGKRFSEPELFLDRPFRCIDSALVLDELGKQWVMVYKDERSREKGGKNLRVATAPLDLSEPWKDVREPIIGFGTAICSDAMTEGASILKTADGWRIYWDAPGKSVYGMAGSRDLIHWAHHTDALTMPPHPRHGTVFQAPRSSIGWLKQAVYSGSEP